MKDRCARIMIIMMTIVMIMMMTIMMMTMTIIMVTIINKERQCFPRHM